MNWGYREECLCRSTVWEGKNFRSWWYTKKVLDTLSNFALKTRYIVFQRKLLFYLVKDIFKWIGGPGRSVTVQLQYEMERIFDLGCIRKKYSILCQISRSKTRYIVFQHNLHFNLVKDFFKSIEGLVRSVTVRVHSEKERIFDLGGIGKKYSILCRISRSKTRYRVFQHKLLFNLVKDWFKSIECHCPITVWKGKIFRPRWYTKKYSIHCQISRSKTRYVVFQHKLHFNLVKDLIKSIEVLGSSVTVGVQSERERIST